MDNGTQKAVQRQRMGILLWEQNFRDVWRRNKSVRAEIGKILRAHTHTHAAKFVVRIAEDITRRVPDEQDIINVYDVFEI